MKKIKPFLVKEHSSPIFYYIRDKNHAPIITICLIKSINGIVCRGIAIRNDIDQINKQEGRDKAFKRAISALYKQENDLFINRTEAVMKIRDIDKEYIFTKMNIFYKSIYGALITEFEQSLFNKMENKKDK
jgi:hypothetical protein